MEYKLLNVNENMDDYKKNLMHPYFFLDFYENLSKAQNLINFIMKNEVTTWFIFSDYCLDDRNKPNNVVTFSLVALKSAEEFLSIKKILNTLQPTDLKKSKIINPAFLNFISLLPVFNISFILPDNRNYIKAFNFKEIEYLRMRYLSLENYYKRMQAFPLNNLDFSSYIKDFKFIQNKFKSKSISLGIFRDIEIINCIVSSLCIVISKNLKLNNKKFIWVSDRDSILTFEKSNLSYPLIFSMINASFKSFIRTENTISFFNHTDGIDPEFDCFNRIPDIVCGTLAEMDIETVSREKYISVIKNYLTKHEVNHIAKLYLDNNKYGINTIKLEIK